MHTLCTKYDWDNHVNCNNCVDRSICKNKFGEIGGEQREINYEKAYNTLTEHYNNVVNELNKTKKAYDEDISANVNEIEKLNAQLNEFKVKLEVCRLIFKFADPDEFSGIISDVDYLIGRLN